MKVAMNPTEARATRPRPTPTRIARRERPAPDETASALAAAGSISRAAGPGSSGGGKACGQVSYGCCPANIAPPRISSDAEGIIPQTHHAPANYTLKVSIRL